MVRSRDSRREDDARRMPGSFMRFELRRWLLGRDGIDRGAVMDMYRELHAEPAAFAFSRSSAGDLVRYVLPALESAFERGRLVALEVPIWRGYVSAQTLHPRFRGMGCSWLADRESIPISVKFPML